MSDRLAKVSGGVDRSFESIDVRHPLYPVACYLFRERLYNSYRHGAKKVIVLLRKLDAKTFSFEVKDTSDGCADVNRLLEPSEDSGATTSMYAFGERIWRLKASERSRPSTYAWKKEGDMFYTVLTQAAGRYKIETLNIGRDSIWTKPEEHGFYSKFDLLVDRLEGRDPTEIVPLLRSIICMTLTQPILDEMHIHIEVRNEDGELLMEQVRVGKPTKSGKPRKMREPRVVGLADSKEERWKSLVKIIRENPHDDFPTIEAEGTLATGATIRVEYSRLKPCEKPYYDGLKEYTEKKANAVLVEMHGFIVPIPLPEALGKAAHPASQNGRFAIITIKPPVLTPEQMAGKSALEIEHLHQKSLPTLASSKVTFLSCPVYQEMLKFLRQMKPSLWDAFVKKSGAASDSESSVSSPMSQSSVHIPEFVPSSPAQSAASSSILHAKLREVIALLRSAPDSVEKSDLQEASEAYIDRLLTLIRQGSA